jgi:hypothetical protein
LRSSRIGEDRRGLRVKEAQHVVAVRPWNLAPQNGTECHGNTTV